MSRTVDKSNLGYLGSEYQYRLAKCFVEDSQFFPSIYNIVDQNTFTEPLLRQFVGVLKDYFSSSGGVVPSYMTMTIQLRQRARTETDREEVDELIRKVQNTTSEGWESTKENAINFFTQQTLIKVANEVTQRIAGGDTSDESLKQCIDLMHGVAMVSENMEDEFNPYDIEEEVFNPTSNIPIPTGIEGLDKVLNGGLDRKKLGLVIGSAGFGKTTFSTAISSYAATCKNEANDYKGYKVLQICFEDAKRDIAKKHFSRISQTEAKDLAKPDFVKNARDAVDNFEEKEIFKENLLIVKYLPNKKTVDDIRGYIKKKINEGFKPDEIVLDYFEPIRKVRVNKTDSKWDMEENCMRDLECLAEEFNVALWVMTQGNKESFTATIPNMAQAGGSVTKVQIGHVILSIGRSLEDQENNRANLTVLKSRQGGSGKVWEGIIFNNGTSTISCSDVVEYDSALLYEETQNEKMQENINHLGRKFVQGQANNNQALPKKTYGNKDFYSQKVADEWEKGL